MAIKRGKNKHSFPNQLTIRKKYQVLPVTKHFATRHKIDGQIVFENQEIHISENLTAFNTIETLLHELLHGVIYEHGVAKLHMKQEEAIVLRLGRALAILFIQNPKLILWLYRMAKKTPLPESEIKNAQES